MQMASFLPLKVWQFSSKNIFSFQPEFVTAMFDVASSINQLNLNDTEIGLLAAVILATPGLYTLLSPLKLAEGEQ